MIMMSAHIVTYLYLSSMTVDRRTFLGRTCVALRTVVLPLSTCKLGPKMSSTAMALDALKG